MIHLHEGVDPSTNFSWNGKEIVEYEEAATKEIMVTNKKLTFLIGLGTRVSKNRIQRFKITFFRNYIHKQEEK